MQVLFSGPSLMRVPYTQLFLDPSLSSYSTLPNTWMPSLVLIPIFSIIKGYKGVLLSRFLNTSNPLQSPPLHPLQHPPVGHLESLNIQLNKTPLTKLTLFKSLGICNNPFQAFSLMKMPPKNGDNVPKEEKPKPTKPQPADPCKLPTFLLFPNSSLLLQLSL
jgi:hypothetical protein